MQKLVYRHHSSDGCSYSFDFNIPFEHESKEAFVTEVLAKFEAAKARSNPSWAHIEIFDLILKQEEIDSLLENVYTLEEWFTAHRETPTITGPRL